MVWPTHKRLGEILASKGLIESEEIDRALEIQQERGDKIGKILVDLGFVSAKTSSTCATWPARRRSSAWSTP
jgi:hypothetical protein